MIDRSVDDQVSRTWRSSLADLVSDQNKSAEAAEARESIRTGARPKAARAAERGESGGSAAAAAGARRFAGGKWEGEPVAQVC